MSDETNREPEGDFATDDLVQRCYVYLEGLHSSLWGEFHHIYEASGRMRAARWLANEINAVLQEPPQETVQ